MIIFTLKNTKVTFRFNHLYALMDTTFSVRILKGGGFLHILINIVISCIKQKIVFINLLFKIYICCIMSIYTTYYFSSRITGILIMTTGIGLQVY